MHRWSRKLIPLTAIALLGAAIPLAPRVVCPLAAYAQSFRSFGSAGNQGRNGRTGTPGQSAPAQTLWLDGTPRQLNLIGGDGRDGEDGERGDRAYCSNQPRDVRYDLQAPDGGNGGSGGSGGNGGNGGDVTLYYTNAADLRQLLVNAAGGRGGRGGRGGLGGEGCRCRYTSWQVETCNNGNCTKERFVCRDGRDGYSGRNGSDGQTGQPGTLRLVNQSEALLAEAPTQTLALDALIQQPVRLSKNLWEDRTGARSLLAPGSVVNNRYQVYIGRVEAEAQILWEAERSPTAFLNLSPTVDINDAGDVQFRFPERMWVAGRRDRTDTLTTYTITNIVRAADATRLNWGQRSGSGRSFTMAVVDLAGESDYLNTQFQLTYRTALGDPRDNRRVRYSTRFDGTVPNNLVTRDNNRFELALGRLPIDGDAFRQGTLVEVELKILRSLGSNSATQTLTWRGRV